MRISGLENGEGMNATTGFIRAALRHGLKVEGAQSVWITWNVVQAAAPDGGVVTVVRRQEETYESWFVRALSSYREIAVRKAA